MADKAEKTNEEREMEEWAKQWDATPWWRKLPANVSEDELLRHAIINMPGMEEAWEEIAKRLVFPEGYQGSVSAGCSGTTAG